MNDHAVMMGWFAWLLLAVLAAALVTAVLYTLAMQYRHAVRVHDLVRDTRQMRVEYLRRRAGMPRDDRAD